MSDERQQNDANEAGDTYKTNQANTANTAGASGNPQRADHAGERKAPLVSRALGWFWKVKDGSQYLSPWKRAVVGLAFLAAGVAGSEAYQSLTARFRSPDAILVGIRDRQEADFKALVEHLGDLRRSVDENGRAALRSVEDSVDSIRSDNRALLAQLQIAQEENKRIAALGSKTGGPSGTYELVLTENFGAPLDATTTLAANEVARTYVNIRLSTRDENGEGSRTLRPGQSVDYVAADGKTCKLSLLSIHARQGAAFRVICPA